jgi:hypothetical protein
MLTRRKLQERIECMQEELDEFKNAVFNQDFAEQADALIDLVYFAKGTAVMMGLPWDKLWDDVQRANMEKVRGVGKRGHAVDMVKPEGWQGPNGLKILTDRGFDIHDYLTNVDGTYHLDETKCADDPSRKVDLSMYDENPPSLLDVVAKRICIGSQAKRGPNMKGPVDVIDGKSVEARTRMASLTGVLPDPGALGKTIHMYEAREEELTDPDTFQKVTRLMVRYGVTD